MNDSIAWPLCGNQVEKKRLLGGGGMVWKWPRPRGGLVGEGGGRQELSGSVCGALHQRGGGAAEESRCSPALTLFTASVTGPVSYRGQPVFGMRASVRVCASGGRVKCKHE